MFSEQFLFMLVIIGLVWTGLGVIALIYLLIKDWKNKQLW